MNRFHHFVATAVATAAWFGAPVQAHASEPDAALPAEWTPVDPSRLDALRGGFQTGSGLVVSFGVERIVAINGAVVSSTRIDIPDVGRMTADEARSLAALQAGSTLQVGAGTTVTSNGIGSLVIQNATDGQSIASFTALNVSVNTLELFQNLNLGSTLNQATLLGGTP